MSQCAQCGTEFSCGMVDSLERTPCWCAELPPLAGVPLSGTCLCPACLREKLHSIESGQQAPDAL